jgi:Uma2 family endonuclease
MPTPRPARTNRLPPLENGDRLDQPTFHARYEAMPESCRVELIGGIVYMPSPQKVPHSTTRGLVVRWLDEYAEATPGTTALLNNTCILGPESEPEPDACLFIDPTHGGQVSVDEDDYLRGPPELIVEVSSSTESIDLHRKKLDYQTAGVQEYVVFALRTQQVFWFVRQRGRYKEVPLPADGIFRSRATRMGYGGVQQGQSLPLTRTPSPAGVAAFPSRTLLESLLFSEDSPQRTPRTQRQDRERRSPGKPPASASSC